tara:strand:+ start:1931 stop:2836 length:906 start_codon:yes stop_codon:yes gene_type:complete
MIFTDMMKVISDKYLQDKREVKPTACNTQNRVSDSGACLRQRGFNALQMEECHTIDTSTLLAFEIGTHMHSVIQDACANYFEGEYETPIDLSHTGVSLSGSCDGLINVDDGNPESHLLMELKTMSPYGFKIAKYSGVPKREHISQASLYAKGMIDAGKQVDAVYLVYISKGNDSRNQITAGDLLEWVIPLDEQIYEYGMSPMQLADAELELFRSVQHDLSNNMLPDAVVFDDEGMDILVENPSPYGVPHKGGHWQCRYCRHNELCSLLGPTEVTLTTARFHADNMKERNDIPVSEISQAHT